MPLLVHLEKELCIVQKLKKTKNSAPESHTRFSPGFRDPSFMTPLQVKDPGGMYQNETRPTCERSLNKGLDDACVSGAWKNLPPELLRRVYGTGKISAIPEPKGRIPTRPR
jgi:hypothetical protein